MKVRTWMSGSGLVLLALVLPLLIGCEPAGPTLHKVSGTLTCGGKPLPGVELVFLPDDTGQFRESFANTDDQGKFTMMYGSNEGVAPGSHTVYIRDPAAMMGMDDQAITDPDIVAALEKYNEESSPMKITVDKDLIDHELKLE